MFLLIVCTIYLGHTYVMYVIVKFFQGVSDGNENLVGAKSSFIFVPKTS